MSYSKRMQENNLYSVFLAPRGRVRMVDLGMQIAQQYLSPYDHIIGLIGDAGSGKSMLIKGMFPGLDLTNDDGGVNVRPLPLLDIHEKTFYSPHTYHVDIQFEAGFTPLHELADAVREVVKQDKRVIIEHFEMLFPVLGRNADLLIGVGEEILITRPNIFGPDPQNVAELSYRSGRYRKMAHTAEDLCVLRLGWNEEGRERRANVRHGFILEFDERPDVDLEKLELEVKEMIAADMPVSFLDDDHVMIGDTKMDCQAPRMHVKSTGVIENFSLIKEIVYDEKRECFMLIGQVGKKPKDLLRSLNKIEI